MLSYYKPIIINDYVYSVDMIRFKFNVTVPVFYYLTSYIQRKCQYDYYQSFRSANYQHLFKIKYLNALESFTLGLLFNGFDKSSHTGCFLEFNPNKVGYSAELLSILDYLNDCGIELELVCYDLAVDIPFRRDLVHLVKDRRVHKRFTYGSDGVNVTEYLGNTAESGRVKLYNKTIESSLDYDCTRLEVTSRHVDYELFVAQFPAVLLSPSVSLLDLVKLSKTDKVLLDLLFQSDDPFFYFKQLGKDKQVSLKPFVVQEGRKVSIPLEIFEKLKKIIFFFKNYKKMFDNGK